MFQNKIRQDTLITVETNSKVDRRPSKRGKYKLQKEVSWRPRSSGFLRCVDWQILVDVSEGRTASIFSVKHSLLALMGPEDKDNTILQNAAIVYQSVRCNIHKCWNFINHHRQKLKYRKEIPAFV
jgi:hypothetical protein